MSNPTRYDFTHPQCAGWDCCGGGRIEEDDSGAYVAFADYIALQDRLTAVEAERDALREQLTHQSYTLTAEHQRAERILAALREPSDAVLEAIEGGAYAFLGTRCLRRLIRSFVDAAEKEVGDAR